MPTNDFLPFGTAVGANVMTQTDYLALTARQNGFSSGTAASPQLNKAWRQASIIASTLAQFIVDQSGQNATDDGTTATLEANLLIAIRAAGRQTTVLTDTGTANTYAAANTPPLAALPTTSGYSQRVNIANANTGASTYAPDGLAAKPVYGLALQPLQGGEMPAGIAVLMYLVQSGVNGGNGAWVLIESLGGASQILGATKSLHATNAGQIQTQALTAFTTAGTAPAFTLTPVPAITAYAVNQRFQVTFNAAGTTPTLNISGLGVKNLKQYTSSGSKIAAIIASGQTSDVVYDGTDLVILDQLPNSTGTTQAQFDNSTNLATTAFVEGVGFQFSGLISLTGNTTLTAAAHAGAMILGNSASSFNATLPLSSTMPAKTVIKLWNFGAGTMTVVCAGSDAIVAPVTATTFALPFGSWVTLASTGAGNWYAVDQSGIGIGQTWTNVTASRAVSTTYTNTTSRPICIAITAANTGSSGGFGITATVAGTTHISIPAQTTGASNMNAYMNVIIPPGATYSVAINNATISFWNELR